MKEELNSFPISDIDPQQVMEELTMLLLYLSKFLEPDRFSNRNDYYAWKEYSFSVLNELDEKDYIRQGGHPSRSKSVYIVPMNPKAELKRLLPEHQQISGARKIAPIIDIENNSSVSFQVFVNGVKRFADSGSIKVT